MINLELIGKRVLEIRKAKKLSREKFGANIGVQGDVIRNIEDNRNKKINEPILISICTEYGINKNWLLYGIGNKDIKNPNTILDELKSTYNLNNYAMSILKSYIEMSEDEKNTIDKFIDKFIDKVKNDNFDTSVANVLEYIQSEENTHINDMSDTYNN